MLVENNPTLSVLRQRLLVIQVPAEFAFFTGTTAKAKAPQSRFMAFFKAFLVNHKRHGVARSTWR